MKKILVLFVMSTIMLSCFFGCRKSSESVRISLDSLSKNIIWDTGITPVDNNGEDNSDSEEQGDIENISENPDNNTDGENTVPEVPAAEENEAPESKDKELSTDKTQNNGQTSKPAQSSDNNSQNGNNAAQKPTQTDSSSNTTPPSKPSTDNSNTTTQKPVDSGNTTAQTPSPNTNQSSGNSNQSGGGESQTPSNPTASGNTSQTTPIVQAKAEELEMLKIINERRAEVGASALTFNYDIYSYAQTRAEEISEKFDHTRPNGESALEYIKAVPNFRKAGENIYYGTNSNASRAMEAFMNSEGHRNNILDSDYTSVSIALYIKDGKWHFVQLFWK